MKVDAYSNRCRLIDCHLTTISLHVMGVVLFMVTMVCSYGNMTYGLGGIEGTFEYAFDAPWRMEPYTNSSGKIEYGAIPIQLTVHDGMHAGLDPAFSAVDLDGFIGIGRFCQVTVRQAGSPPVVYELDDLSEIEMTIGAWPWPISADIPEYRLCRQWAGENCESLRDISRTSEWHALLWYTPQGNIKPGSVIPLEIEMEVVRPMQGITCDNASPSQRIVLRNHVRVYMGDAPLPRFNNHWVYGDLHYHGQGNDNEGESAYNYRGIVRAMGAMGLDFLFAAEHASDSEQIIDGDIDIQVVDLELHDADSTGGVLRDMNEQRFAFSHELIYGQRGANQEAALNAFQNNLPPNVYSRGIAPQIYLGGEVDVVPEVRSRPFEPITYGNGRAYEVTDLCKSWQWSFGPPCVHHKLWEPTSIGTFLIKDAQGINDIDYGREHLIYFPQTSTLERARTVETYGNTSFVPSLTGQYGGASRRLSGANNGKLAMLPEIERKGFAFIAHHLNDGVSPGPNGPPWSTYMLNEAWRSPAVLGLQFWNEDGRFEVDISDSAETDRRFGVEIGYDRRYEYGKKVPNNAMRDGFKFTGDPGLFELIPYSQNTMTMQRRVFTIEHKLHHGAVSWDRMNHWGLNLDKTRALRSWLPEGQPRRFFMAGGSDAHGDFNYRRNGYFEGTTSTDDTAIGKPRNLVYVGPDKIAVNDLPSGSDQQVNPGKIINPTMVDRPDQDSMSLNLGDVSVRPTSYDLPEAPDATEIDSNDIASEPVASYSHEQVLNAIRQGQYCVTDGPVLRIAIDKNKNGRIDHEDTQMGDIAYLSDQESVELLVEWKSTPEFGPVSRIDFYVGVHSSNTGMKSELRTYAPKFHGVRDCRRDPSSNIVHTYISNGHAYEKMEDGYWVGDWVDLPLRLTPSLWNIGLEYHGTWRKSLDLSRFEAFQGKTGDRFFIRAFASTHRFGWSECPEFEPVPRYAFTNPIWVLRYQEGATWGVDHFEKMRRRSDDDLQHIQ